MLQKGVFKKVYFGGPVGGVYQKTKIPPSSVPGGKKMENIKNQTKKCISYTIQGI
jgi:hypothetical protein